MGKKLQWWACAVFAGAMVGCAEQESIEKGQAKQQILDPRGPDISIERPRLVSSVRVVSNATVSQAEVDEGCAAAPTGRTLVRFDVVTPNHGPADLEFGSVSCRSSDPSPACAGVDCSLNPACCCDGRNVCTTSSGRHGAGFEYACPHGHIHFKSFAQYRLLNQRGEVAASGHKQSFCLMDIEGIGGGQCRSRTPFNCGNQGIHAGCADVYSSALPCSFVDATGVPAGDYVLEVRMDPLDIINESNESNNVATAPVRIGNAPAPPAPPSRARYLVRDGVGTQAEADSYYSALRPGGLVPGTYTLERWKQDFIGVRPQATALYRNANELGFWREMTCTRTLGRGNGGCLVTNWADPTDRDAGRANKGTVAMRLDDAGRTQFFAFAPDGRLSPSAVLDDEGAKMIPRLCTNCHGGEYRGAGSDPDLGSIFREFEPSKLQRRPGISAEQAEAEWFALNMAIRDANRAVRPQAEGGPFGVDAAKAEMETYLGEMYVSTAPPRSRAVGDAFHLPASWQTGATDAERRIKAALYSKVVNPYCMTCHRTSAFNYRSYATFQTVAALQDGRALLRRYIEDSAADPNRQALPFMPQSKLQWQNLANDAEALIAIDDWLQGQGNRPPVAAAGADRIVTAGATVALSAQDSRDPDGDPLTYQWSVSGGPAVTLAPSATARDVTFVAPAVAANTVLTAS